ncbi:MAG: hypothetical protein AMXMBFR33_59130 [Candidatus Xenobia bacterium]
MIDPEAECQRLTAEGTVDELLAALGNDASYDANHGDVYGGTWPVAVSETAADLLAARGPEVLSRVLELVRHPGPRRLMAARALAQSAADLAPHQEELLELYFTGPDALSLALAFRLARMGLSGAALERLDSHPARALRLLRLEDGPALLTALERVPELLRRKTHLEEALSVIYCKPVSPWLERCRDPLIELLGGPFAERAAETLGFLAPRDVAAARALAELAAKTDSERLAGVALRPLQRLEPSALDSVTDVLDAVLAGPHRDRKARVMPLLRRDEARPEIERYLASLKPDCWQAKACREALARIGSR